MSGDTERNASQEGPSGGKVPEGRDPGPLTLSLQLPITVAKASGRTSPPPERRQHRARRGGRKCLAGGRGVGMVSPRGGPESGLGRVGARGGLGMGGWAEMTVASVLTEPQMSG